MERFAEYAGLFGASLLAATLLPAQSEVILFRMLLTDHYSTWALVLVASVGNVLGSCINWFLGRFIAHFEDRRWFPVKREAIARQGDSVLRVGIGVSAIHALGDGRWRPGMSGSDGARGADLWEVFSVVPDHRRAEGKRYPLAGLLMIALAAMLAGRSDQLGIVRWGRKLSREALAELGILRGRVPAPSVWSELFRALDVGALERLLGAWVKGAGAAGHVAIDGKRLRGSAVGDGPGVHLLAAFSERLQGVIGQLRVAPEANEITAALTLLKTLPIEGAIISGDAIFAQTDLCRLIIERGGDYFFTVKSNQPTLEADIALAFRPDSPLCGVGARA